MATGGAVAVAASAVFLASQATQDELRPEAAAARGNRIKEVPAAVAPDRRLREAVSGL